MKHLLSIILLSVTTAVSAQINIQLLHQLVGESKSEYEKQISSRDKQSLVTANEQVNRAKLAELKHRYRDLRSRFHQLKPGFDAVQIGFVAAPILSDIIRNQEIIYSEASHKPWLAPLAIQTEKDIVIKARALSKYLLGLAMTIGDINQMKSSDRSLLFNHVVDELKKIAGVSRGLAVSFQNTRRKEEANFWQIDEDKKRVDGIIKQIKVLGH